MCAVVSLLGIKVCMALSKASSSAFLMIQRFFKQLGFVDSVANFTISPFGQKTVTCNILRFVSLMFYCSYNIKHRDCWLNEFPAVGLAINTLITYIIHWLFYCIAQLKFQEPRNVHICF